MNNLKNNKLLPALTILLLVVNIIALTMLWTGHNKAGEEGPLHPPAGPVFEFVSKELNLDKQQQEQYKVLRTEHQLRQRPLADSIRKAKDAFFDLLKNTAATDSQINLLNQHALALQGQLELVNFKHFQKLRAICNPQQQEQFDTIIQTVLKRLGGPGPGRQRPPFKEGEGRPGDDLPPPPNR
jgi:hypothetical protein